MILGGRYAAFTFILQKNRKQSLFVQCAIIVLHLTKSFAVWRRVAGGVSPLPYSANRRYCIAQPYSAAGRVSLRPCPANERYYILQHYSAGSGGAFAFAEHTELSLASRKTVAFAGRVSLLPYSANVRYCITQPVARTTAMSFLAAAHAACRRICSGRREAIVMQSCLRFTLPPLSFRLSERQRTHGEISHIVRLFSRAASCRGRIPCSARNDMLRRGCRPRFTRLA